MLCSRFDNMRPPSAVSVSKVRAAFDKNHLYLNKKIMHSTAIAAVGLTLIFRNNHEFFISFTERVRSAGDNNDLHWHTNTRVPDVCVGPAK